MCVFSCYGCHSHCVVSLARTGQARACTVTCGSTKLEKLDNLCYYQLCVHHCDTKACRPGPIKMICCTWQFLVCIGSDEDAWHNQDFLPLPMSESYKLPSRKKRSQPEDPEHRQNMLSHDKPGRWAHDKHDQDDPGNHPAGSAANPDLRGRSGHVERAMKVTGLNSSASEEEEEQDLEEQQTRKRRKIGSSSGQKPAQQKQRSFSSNPFGALLRHKDQDLTQGNHDRSAVMLSFTTTVHL